VKVIVRERDLNGGLTALWDNRLGEPFSLKCVILSDAKGEGGEENN
jgi:hypothetical protein